MIVLNVRRSYVGLPTRERCGATRSYHNFRKWVLTRLERIDVTVATIKRGIRVRLSPVRMRGRRAYHWQWIVASRRVASRRVVKANVSRTILVRACLDVHAHLCKSLPTSLFTHEDVASVGWTHYFSIKIHERRTLCFSNELPFDTVAKICTAIRT